MPIYNEEWNIDFLKKIDNLFLSFVKQRDSVLHNDITSNKLYDNTLIVKLSIILEEFLIEQFSIYDKYKIIFNHWREGALIQAFKTNFIRRSVIKSQITITKEDKEDLEKEIKKYFNKTKLDGHEIYEEYNKINKAQNTEKNKILALIKYTKWLITYGNKDDEFLRIPASITDETYFQYNKENNLISSNEKYSIPEDFNLSAKLKSSNYQTSEAFYCLKCHTRGLDSCKNGLHKNNFAEYPLNGCPIKQDISEMITVAQTGNFISAIAIAMINNPFLILTGHKICNDCSKSCIFQKQEPVDVPEIETRLLTDLLSLDWGVEIYYLLMLWNPLKQDKIIKINKKPTKHIIIGSGPAAMSLSYYLLFEGNIAVMTSPEKMNHLSKENIHEKIKDYKTINIALSKRKNLGLGGVMEYGITKRWNKNYLNLMYIFLSRFDNFHLIEGIKFGSNINVNDIQDLGFDHLSLATGCGTVKMPYVKNIENAKGAFLSSDVLMSINMQQGWKEGSLSDLQLDVPIVIIGGGLTAIDVATETKTYYLKQIEKASKIYEQNPDIIYSFSDNNKIKFEHYYKSWKIISAIKNKEQKENFINKLIPITIISRKKMTLSPAYYINHKEIQQALKEGIQWIEEREIIDIIKDEQNSIKAVQLNDGKYLPCRNLIFSTGTIDNISFTKQPKNKLIKIDGNRLNVQSDKITNNIEERFAISVLGDANHYYKGSVIKAIASAKNHYKTIISQAKEYQKKSAKNNNFIKSLDETFRTKIESIEKITEDLFIISIASFSAKKTKPTDIFRLVYNHESDGIPITAIYADDSKIDFVLKNEGAATKEILEKLKENEEITLTGPNNIITEEFEDITIVTDEKHLLPSIHYAFYFGSQGNSVELNTINFSSYETLNILMNKYEKIEQSIKIKKLRSGKEVKNTGDIISFTGEDVEKPNRRIWNYKNSIMNCMLGGVCGKCSKINNEEQMFGCMKTLYLNNNGEYNEIVKNDYNEIMKKINLWQKTT